MKEILSALLRVPPYRIAAGICVGLVLGAGALAVLKPDRAPVAATATASSAGVTNSAVVKWKRRSADFGSASASIDVRSIANWIADSRDAGALLS